MNAKLYVETLSQKLLKIADLFCYPWLHLSTGHMAKLAQDWIATNCSEFIGKDEWPSNSLTSTLWITMSGELCLNAASHFNSAWERRWAQESSAVDMGPAATWLDQESHIELPRKTLSLCESWWWTLRTYDKMNYMSDFGICNNSQCFLTTKITSCCWLLRAELKIWHRIFIQP